MYEMAPLKYSRHQSHYTISSLELEFHHLYWPYVRPFTLLDTIRQNGTKVHFVRQNGIRRNGMTP